MSRRRERDRRPLPELPPEQEKPAAAEEPSLLPSAVDMVRALTDWTSHREEYVYEHVNGDDSVIGVATAHVTRHPSLLEQLDRAVQQSSSAEEGSRPGFGPKPAARLDALDTLIKIDDESARWVRRLGQDDSGSTADCVRAALALSVAQKPCVHPKPRELCCVRHVLEYDIRRWWTWARITTGWDLPAWRPNNTCPLCGKRGGLRVRVAASAAVCVECWDTWDATTIGLLAAHIRSENECSVDGCVRPPRKDGRCVEHAEPEETPETDMVTLAEEVCPDPSPPPPVLSGLL